MSLLFIVPENETSQGFHQCRPMGLFFLMGALKKIGIESEILNLETKKLSDEEIVKKISQSNYDIFGITCTSHTRFNAIKMARLIKRKHPKKKILVGGPHFSQCPEDALIHIPEIDIVVRGEAEETICELVPKMLSRKDWSGIKGISYRKGDTIVTNSDAPPPSDLDSLPIFTDFHYEDYPEYLINSLETRNRLPCISILTSRGCPYHCIFCCVKNSGYRKRSPKSVVDEMVMWQEKFPQIKAFNFFDLTFTADPCHVKEVCHAIISRKIDAVWWAESRINIELELLDLMKKAGCVSLSIGVETGSPRILKEIKKNIAIESVYRFVERCEALGITLKIFFMASHPNETEEDLEMTRKMIYRLVTTYSCIIDAGAGVSVILPGTELEQISRKKGILPPEFSWHKPFYQPENLLISYSANLPLYIENISREKLIGIIHETGSWFTIKNRGRGLALFKWGLLRLFSKNKSWSYKSKIAWSTMKAFLFEGRKIRISK